MNMPGQPAFSFNVPPPPAPPAFGAPGTNFPPTMPMAQPLAPTPAPVPAPIDWEAKAREIVQAKVYIDGKPISTPQMVVWAMQEMVKRMGNPPDAAQKLCSAMEGAAVGAVNLGNDNEEALTFDQRHAKVLELIPTKLTWKGAACVGTPDYLKQVVTWLWGNIPAVTSIADNNQKMVALHNWIRNVPGVYELDDATRAAQVQMAPSNPVSDQVTPQQAAPVAPVAPTPVAGAPAGEEDKDDPVIDPVDGTKCKNLRGLKTRVTRTHKVEWSVFCQQHSLDPATGRKKDGSPVVPAPVAPPAGAQPPASPPLPALVGQGAPVNAPEVPINTLYQPNGQPTPEYAAAQAAAAAANAQPQAMPVPPAQQPTTPVAFTPTFQAPPAVPVPAAPVITPTFQDQPPQMLQVVPANQSFSIAPTPQQIPQAGTMGLDRNAMAIALGGPVRLIVCRLLEVNSVNLAGTVDANQLALMAEKKARDELRIADLSAAQYGAGKQAAQRHFADLLTRNPNCYLLMNGYEFIIPDGYLEILIARTVYVYHSSVRDGAVEIKF